MVIKSKGKKARTALYDSDRRYIDDDDRPRVCPAVGSVKKGILLESSEPPEVSMMMRTSGLARHLCHGVAKLVTVAILGQIFDFQRATQALDGAS